MEVRIVKSKRFLKNILKSLKIKREDILKVLSTEFKYLSGTIKYDNKELYFLDVWLPSKEKPFLTIIVYFDDKLLICSRKIEIAHEIFKNVRSFDDVFDRILAAYRSKLSELETELSNLETKVLENPEYSDLRSILQLKEAVKKYWKVFRVMYVFVFKRFCKELEEAEDLLERFCELYRESNDLVMLYLSSIQNKLNEIMKLLTLITIIYAPANLIAAIWGMNFANMNSSIFLIPPTLTFLFILFSIVISYVFLKVRGWL